MTGDLRIRSRFGLLSRLFGWLPPIEGRRARADVLIMGTPIVDVRFEVLYHTIRGMSEASNWQHLESLSGKKLRLRHQFNARLAGVNEFRLYVKGEDLVLRDDYGAEATDRDESTGHQFYSRPFKVYSTLELLTIVLSIVALLTAGVSVYYAGVAVTQTALGVGIALEALEEARRPPFLIVELSSEKGSFDDSQAIYLLGGPPSVRPDEIRINIWNTGTRVAENVTVRLTFEAVGTDLLLYDIMSLEVCRELDCGIRGSPAVIRAIEPNGFYTIKASIQVYAANLSASGRTLYLVIEIVNPSNSQQDLPPYRYVVQT